MQSILKDSIFWVGIVVSVIVFSTFAMILSGLELGAYSSYYLLTGICFIFVGAVCGK